MNPGRRPLALALDNARSLPGVKTLYRLAQEFRIAIIVVTRDKKIFPPANALTISATA